MYFIMSVYLIMKLECINNNKMTQQQWKGLTSKRFSGGRNHNNHPQDALASFLKEGLPSSKVQGIKTFSIQPSPQATFVPCLRVYGDLKSQVTYEVPTKGKKVTHLPQQSQRKRKQKWHIEGGSETNNQIEWKGIKVYDEANKSRNKDYYIENMLQRKVKIQGLDEKRNHLDVASLGDKSYKYPQYSSNFYKEGGLITGSTISYHGKKNPLQPKITGIFTKPNWDVRLKMEEQQQQKRVLNSVDQWEKTTLIEANPNWNDPDKFFERQEAKTQALKDPKKNAKK